MIRRSVLSLLLVAAASAAFAQAKTFKVGGFDSHQIATVESDTEFETFTGRTHKVSGSLLIDPSKKTGSGTISVDLTTVDTGIALRDEHMRSPGWLDTAKFPQAKFEATKIKSAGGDNYDVTGKFTIHGVTKDIKVKVKAKYIAESELTKSKGFKGDVLHIAAKFPIKLADYGINIPSMASGKVAPEVTISISAFATTE